MKSKKGFTLTELLVVIVILGIITGLSIPLIRNIQANNENKQYTTYMDSVRQSAKVYTNSYQEDMFGHNKSGCAIVSYEELEEKGLLKDIMVDNMSCNSEETFVKVVKIDDKLSYQVAIGCGKVGEDGKVNVKVQFPKEGIGDISNCVINAETIVSFETTPAPNEEINFQRRNITLNMTSHTGFHEDINMWYGFTREKNENTNVEPTLMNGWSKLKVNYIGGNEQKRDIEVGKAITLSSEGMITPANTTGDIYLVLRIDNLKDISGSNWTTEPTKGKFYYIGTFRVDNDKPSFGPNSSVISSEPGYNSIKPKLNLDVTDNNKFSTPNDLRMCTSYDSDTCPKDVDSIKGKKNGYIKYNANKVLDPIKPNYDGTDHTIYVTVGDAAGNYVTKSFSYKLAFLITYDGNGKTGGSVDATPCDINTDCILRENSFERTGYNYTGWYNAANGGTKQENTIRITGNTTIYAGWIDDIKPTCSVTKTGGSGSENGITVEVTCNDEGSKCTEATHTYTGIKENKTFTVKDNSGNECQATVTVTGSDCNPYQCNCYNQSYNCRTEYYSSSSGGGNCQDSCMVNSSTCYQRYYCSRRVCDTRRVCSTCHKTCYD